MLERLYVATKYFYVTIEQFYVAIELARIGRIYVAIEDF